jgi:hypothetical protein
MSLRSRRSEGAQSAKRGRPHLRMLFLVGAAALGFYLGLNLSEERKHRVKKLMFEAREMPFRIFV